jgi:hypothetical protein
LFRNSRKPHDGCVKIKLIEYFFVTFSTKRQDIPKNRCIFANSFCRKMSQITEKTIDISEILKGKMGAKAKYVPAPVVS